MADNKQLLFAIYLPSFLIALVQGLVILLIPLFTLDEGSSWLGAGFLFALRSAGTLASSLPSGVAITRFGERNLMLLGTLLIGLACLGVYQWHSFISLAIFMLLFGLGMGMWTLARQTLMSGYNRSNELGRAMSVVSSLQRTGTFVGPLLGGLLSQYYSFEIAFLFAAALVTLALLLLFVNKVVIQNQDNKKPIRQIFLQLPSLIKQHQSIFIRAGLFVAALRLARGARQLLLPLWGHHIGLDTAEIAFAFALSAFADVVFMYAGGSIADKYGRKWSGGICLCIVSLSLLLLPLSADYFFFSLIAFLAGVGNGLGGGIIMTMGADLAPANDRGVFLGAWRMTGDISGTLSPLLVGGLANLFTLGTASVLSGGMGLLGLGILIFFVQETLINDTTKKTSKTSNQQ